MPSVDSTPPPSLSCLRLTTASGVSVSPSREPSEDSGSDYFNLSQSADTWCVIYNFEYDDPHCKQQVVSSITLLKDIMGHRIWGATLVAGLDVEDKTDFEEPLPACFFRSLAYLLAYLEKGKQYKPVTEKDLQHGQPVPGWCSCEAIVNVRMQGRSLVNLDLDNIQQLLADRLFSAAPYWHIVSSYEAKKKHPNLEGNLGADTLKEEFWSGKASPLTPMVGTVDRWLEKGPKPPLHKMMPLGALLQLLAQGGTYRATTLIQQEGLALGNGGAAPSGSSEETLSNGHQVGAQRSKVQGPHPARDAPPCRDAPPPRDASPPRDAPPPRETAADDCEETPPPSTRRRSQGGTSNGASSVPSRNPSWVSGGKGRASMARTPSPHITGSSPSSSSWTAEPPPKSWGAAGRGHPEAPSPSSRRGWGPSFPRDAPQGQAAPRWSPRSPPIDTSSVDPYPKSAMFAAKRLEESTLSKASIRTLSSTAPWWSVCLSFRGPATEPQVVPGNCLLLYLEQRLLAGTTLMIGLDESVVSSTQTIHSTFLRPLQHLLNCLQAGQDVPVLNQETLKGVTSQGAWAIPRPLLIQSGGEEGKEAGVRELLNSCRYWHVLKVYEPGPKGAWSCTPNLRPTEVIRQYDEGKIYDGNPVLGTNEFKPRTLWLPTALMIPLGALWRSLNQGYIYQAPSCADLVKMNTSLERQV